MSATDQERIADILEFAETISLVVAAGISKFESSKLSQLAVERLIISIGEACSKMSPDYQVGHPDIPWRNIIGMRNILIHAYHRIEVTQVWQSASVDIPNLVNSLKS